MRAPLLLWVRLLWAQLARAPRLPWLMLAVQQAMQPLPQLAAPCPRLAPRLAEGMLPVRLARQQVCQADVQAAHPAAHPPAPPLLLAHP